MGSNNRVNLSEEDKKDLIKEFNIRGYLLEDKVIEILSNHVNNRGILKGPIAEEYGIRNKGQRVEIDAVVRLANKVFVVEVKRSEYNWIFTQSHHRPNDKINLVHIVPKKGNVVRTMTLDENCEFKIVFHDFAIGMARDKLERANKFQLVTPRERQPVHDAIRQVLKESKAALLEKDKFLLADYSFLIPVIVTNARLMLLDYDKEQITDEGDLNDFSELKEVGAVGFNFHEYFGFSNEAGLSSNVPEEVVKTVLIVNIKHLKEFIDYFSEMNIKEYFGRLFFTSDKDKVSGPID